MTIQLNGKTPTKICMFQPRLPAEYQEVEYIESSGTQYIDSGIPGANGYIAEAKIVFNDVGGTTDDAYLLGSAGSSPNFAAYITKQGQGVRRWRQSIANDQYIVGGSVTTNTEYVVKSTILTSGNSLIVNGSTIGTRTYASSYNNGYNLWIFAMNNSGAIGEPFKGKCYYLKIWQGSESNLVRDFIPCYRKADSVIGMYDLVNDTFYTNSGSGTFTKGNNIRGEKEIKKIVIFPDGVTEKQIRQVGWQPGVNTVLYLPLESDVKDYSPNNRGTFTNVGTLGQKGGVNCRYCGTTGGIFLGTSANSYLKTSTNQFTCSAWLYSNGQNSYNSRFFEFNVNGGIGMGSIYGLANSTNGNFGPFGGSSRTFSSIATAQTWVNLIIVNNDGSFTLYRNGQQFDTWTDNTNHGFGNGMSYQNGCNIAGNRTSAGGGYDNESLNGGMREFIWEDKARTAQEISDYYNQTKGNYGL